MSTTHAPASWHVHQQLGVPTARLNPVREGNPFAVVEFPSGSYFSIDDPGEADRLAGAFAEAARLLREGSTS